MPKRTVGCDVKDSGCERLCAVVESEGMMLGEWCCEVVLERVEERKPSVIEEALLAEALALRTIRRIYLRAGRIMLPGC